MSQKIGKRTRRRTEEELEKPDNELKNSNSTEKEENEKSETNKEIPDEEVKGFHPIEMNKTNDGKDEKSRIIQTRSRSSTPIVKRIVATENAQDTKIESKESENASDSKELNESVSSDAENQSSISETNTEVELKLKIDENLEDDDIELEGSPVRCRTRRSKLPVTVTPKTPILETDKDEEKNDKGKKVYVSLVRMEDINKTASSTPKQQNPNEEETGKEPEEQEQEELKVSGEMDKSEHLEKATLNGQDESSDSFASTTTDDISTKVVVGSDATRNNIELMPKDSGLFDGHSNAFLNISKDKSLVETCRRLSSRKSIRPLNADYRRGILKKHLENRDRFDSPYPSRQSVERITGIKRKNYSITPPDSKRARTDSNSLFSYISKPITNLKRRISRSDLQSSTPKLTGFKTNNYDDFGMGKVSQIGLEVNTDSSDKKWCSIM